MDPLTIRERLKQSSPVILDGALGTELERRGVPTPEPFWSAEALLTEEGCHAIDDIHTAYIRAGAEIITANTFRSNIRAATKRGVGAQAEAITKLAVTFAQDARDRAAGHQVWVAGSISPVEDCFSPWLVPNEVALRHEHGLAARWLAEAGVDIILVETMNRIDEARIATEAAVATGLPVLTSFVCAPAGTLLSGESIADAVAAIEPCDPTALMVNCIPTPLLSVPLRELARATSRPIGAYGNMGPPVTTTSWELERDIPPNRYRDYAVVWREIGARIIGGCCGTTPEHIATIRHAL